LESGEALKPPSSPHPPSNSSRINQSIILSHIKYHYIVLPAMTVEVYNWLKSMGCMVLLYNILQNIIYANYIVSTDCSYQFGQKTWVPIVSSGSGLSCIHSHFCITYAYSYIFVCLLSCEVHVVLTSYHVANNDLEIQVLLTNFSIRSYPPAQRRHPGITGSFIICNKASLWIDFLINLIIS